MRLNDTGLTLKQFRWQFVLLQPVKIISRSTALLLYMQSKSVSTVDGIKFHSTCYDDPDSVEIELETGTEFVLGDVPSRVSWISCKEH